jgi:type IV pilus assembly protein PilW
VSGQAQSQRGVSLIELMVAMVLGVLVAAGITTVFISTSSSNRVQTQMAHLQEEGRFAITQLKSDLSMANGQYCTGSGGNAHLTAAGSYIDGLRAPTIYASSTTAMKNALSDLTTPWGSPYPTAPTAPYSLPSFMSMRGYDCTTTGCTPLDPAAGSNAIAIPLQGKAVGNRVPGTDVLTVRYLDSSKGWKINPTGSTLVANKDGTLKQINLAPMSDEANVATFKNGDLAMLADCSNAQVFAVNGGGTATLVPNGSNFALPSGQGIAAPKVFDFNHDFQTVTYYVQVVDNGQGTGQTTGALMRRVNGDSTNAELVRGVERLDFRYGVQYPDGSVHFLTANQVDASDNTTPGCTAKVPIPVSTGTDKGCLWRAITSIEVDLLMDGQAVMPTLSAYELPYTYGAITTPTLPDAQTVKPTDQGFENKMIRREFTALVSVRNFNP